MTQNKKTTRAVALIYVRKSQVKKGQLDPASPEMQEREGRRIAQARGWYPEILADAKGHNSGKTAKRAAFQRLMARAKDSDIAAVIVYRYSRLARNAKMLLTLLDEWTAAGVQLVSVADSIDVSTPQGRLFFTVAASFDEFNSNDAGQWRADNIDYLRRQKGRHYGLPPFGTRRIPKDGDLVLMPSELAQPKGTDHDALRMLYELYNSRLFSMRNLALRLNADGWRYRNRDGILREWTNDDVRRALASAWLYSGMVTVGRAFRDHDLEILPGSHAPILPDALTAPVIKRLRDHRKLGPRQRQPMEYPLTGSLYCACDQHLVGTSARGVRYYRHIYPCAVGAPYQRPADVLELAVREHLACLHLPDDVRVRHDADLLRWLAIDEQEDTAESERQRILAAVDRLADLYADGQIDRTAYDRKKADYLARLPSGQGGETPSPMATIPMLPDFSNTVRLASAPILRDIVRAIYERITVSSVAGNGNGAGAGAEIAIEFTAHEWSREWAG